MRRKEELKGWNGQNLEPHKLKGYPNRFASSIAVLKHLLEQGCGSAPCWILKGVISWWNDGKSLNKYARMNDASESEVLRTVRNAFNDPQCLLELFVVYVVLKGIPSLIESASADPKRIDPLFFYTNREFW